MNDDWRLRIVLGDPGDAGMLTDLLREHAQADDMRHTLHDRVIVSADEGEVFCYAGTREQAQAAAAIVDQLSAEHGWNAEVQMRHWHPTAERWEDPDIPLPDTDAARAAEHAERVAQERADSAEQGFPDWEVRIQCGSRSEAGELADRLREQGIVVVHRWSAVLAGATDEDSASALAQRLRGEAPTGATVTVEGNLRAVYEDRPWRQFSILGGLGG